MANIKSKAVNYNSWERSLLIHATNITGVGASHVIVSFLDAASDSNFINDSIVYLPAEGPLAGYLPSSGRIIRYKRYFTNNISRLFECLFAVFIMPKTDITIVLGDLPLTGIKNQVVLVHQPNLLYPKVNPLSSNALVYKVLRFFFKFNLRFVKAIIVQTGVMAQGLEDSYPEIKGKITIMPQPVPNWFKIYNNLNIKIKHGLNKVILFYPAAGYAHKNHKFLIQLYENFKSNNDAIFPFEIWLTLSDIEIMPYKNIPFIKNLGRLNAAEMLSCYEKADALLFLSLTESYGFPLVEGLVLKKPIICVDLPYARWMCEDVAYYFNNNSVKSFIDAFIKLKHDLEDDIKKDYDKVLIKFPLSWEEVVTSFKNVCNFN